ncbi:MAG: tetratricopeptide repeat protein [Thermoanaerobaculia bacterium]
MKGGRATLRGPTRSTAAALPRYAYVYGIALHSAGELPRALKVLRKVHDRHPGDRDVLEALAMVSLKSGDREASPPPDPASSIRWPAETVGRAF